MKAPLKFFLFVCLVIFCIPFAEAQYGYGNGYGNGSYGQRRSSVPRADDAPKKEEPLTAEQIVENEMPHITETLDLNPFEQAVVSTILTKYMKQHLELQLLQLDADQMRDGMEKIKINQDKELSEGLPEEKYQAFTDLQKKGYKKKKEKKGKKDKASKD